MGRGGILSHLFNNICVTTLLFNSSIVTHKINMMRCQVSRNSHKVLEHAEVVDMYIIQTNNKKQIMDNTSPFYDFPFHRNFVLDQ